jgi:hypothetical protein
MNDLGSRSRGNGTITIVLVGGPADIPESVRPRTVAATERKIKLAHRGGYEHFELVDELVSTDADGPAVFRWTMRTKIAE